MYIYINISIHIHNSNIKPSCIRHGLTKLTMEVSLIVARWLRVKAPPERNLAITTRPFYVAPYLDGRIQTLTYK